MKPQKGRDGGLHLYCIVPPGHDPEAGLRGVGDEEVRAVAAGEVVVWVSPSAPPPAPGSGLPGIDDIRAHDRVIRAAMTSDVTPLPVRFGQWVEGPEELCERVAGAVPPYREVLAKLAGAMEMGLRVRVRDTPSARVSETAPEEGQDTPWADPDGSGAKSSLGKGRAHLERLARERRTARELESKADELATMLRERLRGLVRADHVPTPDVARRTALICHLVDRTGGDAYRQEIEEFAGQAPELEVTVTGPWPPYSFAP